MSFKSAQQLYDQQEPPQGELWEDCMEYRALLGMDDGGEVEDKACLTCPMKHRCMDGAIVITEMRNNAMIDAYAILMLGEYE